MKKQKHFLSLTICMVLLLSGYHGIAQDTYLKDRWTIKISAKPSSMGRKNITEDSAPYVLGFVSYGLFNSVEVGVSLGVNFGRMSRKPTETLNYSTKIFEKQLYNHPNGELFVNFHPLTYLFDDKEPRFDVYLSTRVGGVYLTDEYFYPGLFEYFQVGGGLGIYFTKIIGVFSEYNYQFDDWTQLDTAGWRFGLTAKF